MCFGFFFYFFLERWQSTLFQIFFLFPHHKVQIWKWMYSTDTGTWITYKHLVLEVGVRVGRGGVYVLPFQLAAQPWETWLQIPSPGSTVYTWRFNRMQVFNKWSPLWLHLQGVAGRIWAISDVSLGGRQINMQPNTGSSSVFSTKKLGSITYNPTEFHLPPAMTYSWK